MAGPFKLDDGDTDGDPRWHRRSAHATLDAAKIELGRDARREHRLRRWRITRDGEVQFEIAGEAARAR